MVIIQVVNTQILSDFLCMIDTVGDDDLGKLKIRQQEWLHTVS